MNESEDQKSEVYEENKKPLKKLVYRYYFLKKFQNIPNYKNYIGGIDLARITSNPHTETIICSICNFVFWKPIECMKCENNFCEKCIKK